MAAGTTAGAAGGVRPGRGAIIRLPGVYRAQADTAMLAAAMHREGIGPGTDLLDLCTGSGALALCAARLGARVTAVDISRRAVASARLNAALARLPVSVHRGDLLSLFPERRFDVLVSNPPYVPAPSATVPSRGAGRAWDAGFDGRILIDRICDTAASALRPGGVLLLVHSELSRPDETLQRLARAGLNASVSARMALPFGPVTRARLPWLRARGLVPSGADQEELVIVRARKE